MILMSLWVSVACAQDVTLSNNLLYDATLTPNLRVGVRLAPHWSVGLTGGYRPWPASDEATRKYRHLLLSPDVRYWADSVDVHHFFGVNLIYSHYNVGNVTFPFGLYRSVRDERRQGDLGALGAYYGYSWPLGRYWNVEALIGAALGVTKFNRYECGHCGRKIGTKTKLFAMPQAALNIVYNIPGRPARTLAPEEPPLVVEPEPAAAPFTPVLTGVAAFAGRAGELRRDNPVLAPASEYRPYDRSRILRKDKDALYVHFPLAQSELSTDFRDNEPTLQRIVDITRQIMADTASTVKVFQIIGLSSVEGPVAVNERLATSRAMALQRYVQQQVGLPDSLFDTVGGGEAWAEFRDQLEDVARDEPTHADQMRAAIDIIDSEQDLDVRERQLRRLNGGNTWAYIKSNVLAEQRNSGYIRIYYDYVPDTVAAVINRASELLRTDCGDCHRQALGYLLTVRHDERAQNALGVAYYLCGRRSEAVECFRRAAARGHADAAENLRQLLIENKM